MNSSNARTLAPCVGALVVGLFGANGCSAAPADVSDQTGATSADLSLPCPPPLPDPSLAVPAGNKLAFHFDAVGVQIYACQASATGFSWVFQAPEANLYDGRRHLVGKHYAGPTWEFKDGSKVVGAKIAAFTPDPTAIPWLLLQAASHEGDGRMSEVTYIQRLETTGGLAPSSGCDADHVGVVARVDYTAGYFFYEAGDGPPCGCH